VTTKPDTIILVHGFGAAGVAITEVKEYPGRAQLLPSQEGWEQVADYALDRAVSHAGEARPQPTSGA
jgi:hypothetical protein